MPKLVNRIKRKVKKTIREGTDIKGILKDSKAGRESRKGLYRQQEKLRIQRLREKLNSVPKKEIKKRESRRKLIS